MNTIRIYEYIKIVWIKKNILKFIYHLKHIMIRKKINTIRIHKLFDLISIMYY